MVSGLIVLTADRSCVCFGVDDGCFVVDVHHSDVQGGGANLSVLVLYLYYQVIGEGGHARAQGSVVIDVHLVGDVVRPEPKRVSLVDVVEEPIADDDVTVSGIQKDTWYFCTNRLRQSKK